MKQRSACGVVGIAALVTSSIPVSASDLDFADGNIPIVLTPTRLRQSLADVPASVTVITAEMIQRYGITTVPDALRLVPGMAVSQVTGNDFRINYHGTSVLVPRRMNVLIDGISVYRPALARVDWKELPVAVEDIDRIEVTRGPNSASYGANSMLAIINIITKHPKEVEGTTVAGLVGSLNTAEGLIRYGGKLGESTAYRMTFDRQTDTGFNYASTFGQGHDSTRMNRLNWRSVTDLASDESLDVQVALVQGTKEIESADRFQRTFPDIQNQEYYVSGTWRKSMSHDHDVQLQAYASNHRADQGWTTCVPTATLLPQMYNLWRANPNYANTILAGRVPSGGTQQDNALAAAALTAIRALGSRASAPTCVDTNQNFVEARKDIELQDTYVFSDYLRMVSGVGARQDMGDSQTYLAGRVTNASYRLFSNVEYKPTNAMNINVGGFLERDQLTGSAFSPRLALNYHFTDRHTMRFVVSGGTRMPDIQEQRANWSYAGTNFSTPLNGATRGFFFQNTRSPGNVSDEKILSKEIGYLGNLPEYGFLIDAKIFDDRLTDLISEKLQLTDFTPTNRNSVRLNGAELQVNYEPTEWLSFYAAYSYVHNYDATTSLEQTQYANHSGAFGVSRLLDNGWRMALAIYGASANTAAQTYYGREDLILSKVFTLGKDDRLTTSFIVRHLDNLASQYFQDFGKTVESRYNSHMQYYVNIKLTF